MFTNLHDAAAAELRREAGILAHEMLAANPGMSEQEAIRQANATVIARRGEAPTIAKALHDLGGPISGGSV